MKKLNRRALSVMMISLFIILGLFTYIERFLREGESWASYFSRLNSLSEGYVTDRNGVLLAAFTANDNSYNEDRNTRIANYHVTGDFWNRTGSGILTNFARQLHGYSPVTGMTQTKHISLKLNVDSVLDNKAYAALAGRKGAVGIVNYRTGELICMVSKVCDIRAVPAFANLQHLVEFLGSYCGRIHQERPDGMILIRRSHRFSERIDEGLEIVIVVVYATSQDVFPFDTR